MQLNLILSLVIIENFFILVSVIYFLIKKEYLKIENSTLYKFKIDSEVKFKNFHTQNCRFAFKTFFELPQVGFYQFKLKKINSHKHPNISSLLYIINGEAHGYIGMKKIHAKPGDFIFVPKNVPHHWIMKKPIEYIELSTPSLTATHMNDIIWL